MHFWLSEDYQSSVPDKTDICIMATFPKVAAFIQSPQNSNDQLSQKGLSNPCITLPKNIFYEAERRVPRCLPLWTLIHFDSYHELFMLAGNSCTSPPLRTAWNLPWIPQEPPRTLEALGKKETNQWNICDPTRTSWSTEKHIRLLMDILTNVIRGNQNINYLNSSCFLRLQVCKIKNNYIHFVSHDCYIPEYHCKKHIVYFKRTLIWFVNFDGL
jgi:hypothetical protein